MADVYRVTIRLSPDLYEQLEARGSHGQPLAAIIRQALEEYLARQPGQSRQSTTAENPTTTLAAMTASIADLQNQVQHLTARLDTLATEWQPPAAREQPQVKRRQSRLPQQPQQPWLPALDQVPAFDATKYSLGQLCPRGHDYHGTGRTLRRLPRHVCPLCDKEQARERRQAKREGAL